MAKKDPIKSATDEYLIRGLLKCEEVDDQERVALHTMLDEVMRLRPITRTRARLGAKSRKQVERRFKDLGLDRDLQAVLAKEQTLEQRVATTPYAEMPPHLVHPVKPPGQAFPVPVVGMRFIDRNVAGPGSFLEVAEVGEISITTADGQLWDRAHWNADSVQVLR